MVIEKLPLGDRFLLGGAKVYCVRGQICVKRRGKKTRKEPFKGGGREPMGSYIARTVTP